MNWISKKVLVTGGNGFLGKHVVNELKKINPEEIISISSKDLDLRINSNCKKVVQNVGVQVIKSEILFVLIPMVLIWSLAQLIQSKISSRKK